MLPMVAKHRIIIGTTMTTTTTPVYDNNNNNSNGDNSFSTKHWNQATIIFDIKWKCL
jgi:hypothetical protein